MRPLWPEIDWTSCRRQAWIGVPWWSGTAALGLRPPATQASGACGGDSAEVACSLPEYHYEDEPDKDEQEYQAEHGRNEGGGPGADEDENATSTGTALLGFQDRFTRERCGRSGRGA